MDLAQIISITGKPGLYKVIKTNKTNFIVESFSDKKRFPAFLHDQISSLDEISIYTEEGDMRLEEVFKAMHEHLEGKEAISQKSSNQELKDFFLENLPDYDEEQVYPSHIKKIVSWYNTLHKEDLLEFEEEKEEEKEDEKVEEKEEEKVEEKEEDVDTKEDETKKD